MQNISTASAVAGEDDNGLFYKGEMTAKTAEDAARRAGLPPEGAEEVLERLADRGVIGARKKDGVTMYSLLPVMPGIFELPFMSGEKTELTERLVGAIPAVNGKDHEPWTVAPTEGERMAAWVIFAQPEAGSVKT